MERRVGSIRPNELILLPGGDKFVTFGRRGRTYFQVEGAIFDEEEGDVGISFVGSQLHSCQGARVKKFGQNRIRVEYLGSQVQYLEISDGLEELPIDCLLGDLLRGREN